MKIFRKAYLVVIALVFVVTLTACSNDTIAPTLTVGDDIEFSIGGDTPDYLNGATVSDDVTEMSTKSITVDSSAVDLTTEGTYKVILSAKDEAGNEGSVEYNVIVSVYVPTTLDKVQGALDALTLDIDNLEFPTKNDDNVKFAWSIDKANIIQYDGDVKPHTGTQPIDVTITVTGSFGDTSATRDFVFTVQPESGVTVTSRELLNFAGTSDEYVVEDKTDIPVYYVDNGTVPYMDMETFVDMIKGAIESDDLVWTYDETAQTMTISYESEWEDVDGTMVTETYTAVVDFNENTFTVNDYGFFGGYISETESDYGEGLDYVDADYVEGKEVSIPLGEYNVDTVVYDDDGTEVYLMPVHVANLLFAGDIYYNVYYNGDKLYGIDTFSIEDGTGTLETTVRTSSYNAKDMEADMRLSTYNFLALTLDYFYGLKDDRGVDSYYSLLDPLDEELLNGTDKDVYDALVDLVYDIDDLHTSHSFAGYYTSPYLAYEYDSTKNGSRTQRFYGHYSSVYWDLKDSHDDPFNMPDYTLADNNRVAIIHIGGFTIDTPDDFKATLDELPSSVSKVVIDLSFNTGGNIGAVLRIFGYMTEEAMQYHSMNPADGSAETYYIESSYDAYNYNWYILTSPVTFSAANMMASMAKESGVATVIGKASTGGASSIGVIITPDGTVMKISTNNVLCTRIGNETDGYEYISVEHGVEPDIPFNDVTDIDEIVDHLN
jgi:hypothetical protein